MGNMKGVEVSDVCGFSEPLTKLVEVVSIGLGKIYEPTHIRRCAKAEADKINILSEAIANNIDVPIKYDTGEISINSPTKQLLQRANNRLIYQELKKQQNIESVIGTAYERLQLEGEVSDDPVIPDWISRFFNIAGEVSDEQMRKIWGRILADELKRPQTFSMRTLDILRNITRHEAQVFEKASRIAFVHPNYIGLPCHDDFNEKYGISYDDILLLSEAGLINSTNSAIGFSYGDELTEENIKDNSLIAGNYAIVYDIKSKYIPKEADKLPHMIEQFNFHLFTQSGKELYSIVEPAQNIEFLKAFCNLCVNKTFFENIRLHKIINLSEDSLDCDENINLLDSI